MNRFNQGDIVIHRDSPSRMMTIISCAGILVHVQTSTGVRAYGPGDLHKTGMVAIARPRTGRFGR